MHTTTTLRFAAADVTTPPVNRPQGHVPRAHLAVLAAAVIAMLLPARLSSDPIFDAEGGHALFAAVLRAGSFGLTDFERAAFIVRDGDGLMRCEAWPTFYGKRGESYYGPMPAGTIAIVHTHPVDWPLPSVHDLQEATRLHLPIYVLTMRNVYRALPDSQWPDMVVRNHLWFKDAGSPLPCADLR